MIVEGGYITFNRPKYRKKAWIEKKKKKAWIEKKCPGKKKTGLAFYGKTELYMYI